MNIEEIVASLRQTESRSKRKLLDEAADAIEELAKTSIVKRIPCEVDPRKEYVELDGIRLVCEEGQIVGWYRPGDGLANPVVLNTTNEKRLIDVDALLNEFLKRYTERERNRNLVFAACEIKQDFADMISDFTTVDAVEVVRCKDCRHCDPENHHCDHYMGTAAPWRRKPDDFCSYGERKEGADNG